jgi:hypothetical protein
MPDINHPTDAELLTNAPPTAAHVAVCSRCQLRLDAPPVPTPAAAGSTLPPHEVGQPMREVMSGIPDFDRSPVPGELWRLEFDGTAAPVVIAEASDGGLVVWAVGEDAEFADTATLRLDGDPLGLPLAVWTSLEFLVPHFVAERWLGDVPASVFERLTAIRNRMLANEPTDADGADFGSDLDPRLTYRERLREPLATFAELNLLLHAESGPETSLRPLLDAAELGPAQLRELGFSPGEIDALGSDKLWLRPDEVARLAAAAHERVEHVAELAPQPPIRLLAALHRPVWRRQVAEIAVKYDIPDAVERRMAARSAWAAPKRTVGTGEPDWDAALDSYFATR